MEVIEPLERELGKPALASNQATLWYCLRLLGLEDVNSRLGRLFGMKAPARAAAPA